MTWVGWRCQKCGEEYDSDPHSCVCGHTVFDPISDNGNTEVAANVIGISKEKLLEKREKDAVVAALIDSVAEIHRKVQDLEKEVQGR